LLATENNTSQQPPQTLNRDDGEESDNEITVNYTPLFEERTQQSQIPQKTNTEQNTVNNSTEKRYAQQTNLMPSTQWGVSSPHPPLTAQLMVAAAAAAAADPILDMNNSNEVSSQQFISLSLSERFD
jgi:hypothetical protein